MADQTPEDRAASALAHLPERASRMAQSPVADAIREAEAFARGSERASVAVALAQSCAEVEKLRKALADIEMLFSRKGENAVDRFERIGSAFFSETGYMRPGKSHVSPESVAVSTARALVAALMEDA